MAGIVAIVVTIVKGHWRRGLGIAALGIGLIVALVVSASSADEEDFSLAQGAWLAAILSWSVLAVLVASRPPKPESQWVRARTSDASGTPARSRQPTVKRLARSFLGALLGVTPSIALMGAVFLLAETGDEAQIAFVGIPLGVLGAGLGGWIGFNWVPHDSRDRVDRSPGRHHSATRADHGPNASA